MADIDQLNSDLQEISTEVDAALQHATDLQTELTTLQNNQQSGQPVDLTSALALADSIKSRLENAGDVVASSGDGTAPAPGTGGLGLNGPDTGTTGDGTTGGDVIGVSGGDQTIGGSTVGDPGTTGGTPATDPAVDPNAPQQ